MIIALFIPTFVSILVKSTKTMMIIVLLETLTIFSIISVVMMSTSLYLFSIMVFVFFVSESLILISVLYSAMRLVGKLHGQLLFF